MKYTKEQLFSLDDKQICAWKGRKVCIVKNDGSSVIGKLTHFGLAQNPPCLISTFYLNDSISISINAIKILQII